MGKCPTVRVIIIGSRTLLGKWVTWPTGWLERVPKTQGLHLLQRQLQQNIRFMAPSCSKMELHHRSAKAAKCCQAGLCVKEIHTSHLFYIHNPQSFFMLSHWKQLYYSPDYQAKQDSWEHEGSRCSEMQEIGIAWTILCTEGHVVT